MEIYLEIFIAYHIKRIKVLSINILDKRD